MVIAKWLENEGIKCNSTWFDFPPHEGETDKGRQEMIRTDLRDIEECNVFLLYNPQEWYNKGTGGRHFETGYALGLKKPVLIYGWRTNLFYYKGEFKFLRIDQPIEALVKLLKSMV